jgi:DNA-binding FadR family transcriptional regulator
MKAVVVRAPMKFDVEDVPIPEIPEGGLLLKVLACGLCGSDLRTLRMGHRKVTFPWTIGHEICGIVEEIGNTYAGQWKVGDKIPTERELVEEFSTSRTVVNAALAELAQKGFLEINPRQWTKVADYFRDGKLEVLYSIVRYKGLNVDMQLMQGILDARKMIEKESVKLACSNRTQTDIDCLMEIIKSEEKAENIEEKIELDFRFHHMLCVAGKNPVYPLIMNSFKPIANKYLKIFYSIIDESYLISVEHIDIVNAIIERDENKAVHALGVLLDEGEQAIKTYGGIKNE